MQSGIKQMRTTNQVAPVHILVQDEGQYWSPIIMLEAWLPILDQGMH